MPAPDIKLELCHSKKEANARENYWAGVITRLGGTDVASITQSWAGRGLYNIVISFRVEKTDPKFIEFMIKMRREMK